MTRTLFVFLLAGILFSGSASAKVKEPVQVIASDLTVESLQFGKFPNGKDPRAVDPRHVVFIPVDAASEEGFAYGYRLKLKTTRSKVSMNQSFDKSPKGTGWQAKPSDGVLYEEWPLDGVRNGQHKVTVWVEGKALPALIYTVKFR